MQSLKEQIKAKSIQQGADLFGVASIDRFANVPAEHHPSSIYPEAKSVIVIGRRILRGSLRSVEEGTNTIDFTMYGSGWLQKQILPMTIYRTVQFIEDLGWESVPLYPYPTNIQPEGIAVAPGRPAPNVTIDFEFAAVAAGLGEIGLGGFLLTPAYGPRQRLGIILTDAKLEADSLSANKLCDKCGECAASCPLEALDVNRISNYVVADKSSEVAGIDYNHCKTCKNGVFGNVFHQDGLPDRLAAICVRSCIDHLERAGRLSTKFNTEFRLRKPWSVDKLGKVKVGESKKSQI